MRIAAASVFSVGLGLALYSLTVLGVPRLLAVVLLVVGVALMAVAAIFWWETSAKRKARAASFPDVAIELTKAGRASVPHPRSPSGQPQVEVAVYGFKLINHEPRRSVVLTFRLFQDFDPSDGGPPDVVCGVFRGDHPEGKHTPPVLQMPVHLAPGAATSGDIMFEMIDWGGKSKCVPQRIEIEDELSATKVDIPPQIGRNRPAQSNA